MAEKTNETEKVVCPVATHLDAFQDALHSKEVRSNSERAALAKVARLLTEIHLGRTTSNHLTELEASLKDVPEKEKTLASSLLTSLAKDKAIWQDHLEKGFCLANTCFVPNMPPCQVACPTHIDIPSMMAHIGHGEYEKSLSVLLKDTPFPNSCGLVCPAPCEDACVQNELSQPVFIRPMKSIASRCSPRFPTPPVAPKTGKKIAVIGAGPAGITTAYYLAQKGHDVEIFDERPEAGGVMRYGIPNYRLPNELLQNEINQVKNLGVKIHNNYTVKSALEFKQKGYDATFIATGLQFSKKLGIDGDKAPFVLGGMDFLSAVRLGKNPRVGPHVIVIGGGNVAIDVAMTAFRQGATKVQIWYRRTKKDMPANPHEVELALAEGVELLERWTPNKVMPDNQIEFIRSKNAPDAATVAPVTVKADHIIVGIGQDGDLSWLEGSQIKQEWGNIIANKVTLETDEPGIFSGGDIQHGASTVVAAIGSGKRAAEAIDAWLSKRDMDNESLKPQHRDVVSYIPVDAAFRTSHSRPHLPEKDPNTRKFSHDFMLYDWDEKEAQKEVGRCLRCDQCIGCGLCELACIQVGAEALKMVKTKGGRFVFEDFMRPASLCVGCGACAAVCPTGAITVENKDGKRVTEIAGTVVRSQALHTCESCGKSYVSNVHFDKTKATLGAVGETLGSHCPTCAKNHAMHSLASLRRISR